MVVALDGRVLPLGWADQLGLLEDDLLMSKKSKEGSTQHSFNFQGPTANTITTRDPCTRTQSLFGFVNRHKLRLLHVYNLEPRGGFRNTDET